MTTVTPSPTQRVATLLVTHFGNLPEWFPLFLHTCSPVRSMEWVIFTDDYRDWKTPENVRMVRLPFSEYLANAGSSLGVDIGHWKPYKLCDLRPFLGTLHANEVGDTRFWGFCDLDIVVGDLDRLITDRLSSRIDLVTMHETHVSGHFSLIRNTPRLVGIGFEIPGWQELLVDPRHRALDEWHLTERLFPLRRIFGAEGDRRIRRILAAVGLKGRFAWRKLNQEMFTTPLTDLPWPDGSIFWDHPLEWEWEGGKVRASRSGMEVPYIHFMNFKSSQWLKKGILEQRERRGTGPDWMTDPFCEEAPWQGLSPLVRWKGTPEVITRIRVGPGGIEVE